MRLNVMNKKKYKKQKLVKADDPYTDGLIEFARYGKVVSMCNLSTPEQHTQIQTHYGLSTVNQTTFLRA